MTTQIIIVIFLTFTINLITTLSYAVRMVGIRTGRIAISFALFNILVLVSRTANGFQAPLLAKTVEEDLKRGSFDNADNFRLIIFSCSVATIAGALLIPTFQRILAKAVVNFSVNKSVPHLIFHGFSKAGLLQFRENLALPAKDNLTGLKIDSEFPWKIFLMNVFAVSFMTIGVLSAVYASYLNPDYRTTASNMSALINGTATILMFIFIDPHLSSMTDDVMMGKCSESTFRKNIIYMTIARFIGTIVAQFLFIPGAKLISWVATVI
jgi:hypothetical protein